MAYQPSFTAVLLLWAMACVVTLTLLAAMAASQAAQLITSAAAFAPCSAASLDSTVSVNAEACRCETSTTNPSELGSRSLTQDKECCHGSHHHACYMCKLPHSSCPSRLRQSDHLCVPVLAGMLGSSRHGDQWGHSTGAAHQCELCSCSILQRLQSEA